MLEKDGNMKFQAYASEFDVFPREGEAFEYLSPLLLGLKNVEFTMRVKDPSKNQGQIVSDFDEALEKSLLAAGADSFELKLPKNIPQKHDFAFSYGGRNVAAEIEKTNREKILRDLLKCHMYLHESVDYALIVLPRNYPHKLGLWDLYDFGVARLRECIAYGFGTPGKLGRILLVGFSQFDAASKQRFNVATRHEMRSQAGGNLSHR